MTTQPPDLKKLRELIGAYWACAYREGQQDRTHDTPSGEAQSLCNAIESELKGIAKAIDAYEAIARDADILRTAMERLSRAPGCGCSPVCRCGEGDWTRYELEGRMDDAQQALKGARHATQGD